MRVEGGRGRGKEREREGEGEGGRGRGKERGVSGLDCLPSHTTHTASSLRG